MTQFGNTAIYGLALIAERMVSFFLLPVLARAISPQEYAIWSQSVVVAGVLTPVVLLGFQTAVVKYYPVLSSRLSPSVFDSVLLGMFSAILVSIAAISAVSIGFAGNVAELVYGDAALAHYVILLAGLLISEALFEFLTGILRATDRIRRIALYVLLKGIWRIGIFVMALYATGGDFSAAFVSFVVAQLLFVITMYAIDIPNARILRCGYATGMAHWKELLAFSLPLVILAVMTGLNNFTDRFFLAHLRSLDEVATYAAAYSLAAIAAFFYSVLGFTLFPVLSQRWSRGLREEAIAIVRRAIKVYLVFLLPFVVAMGVLGQDILMALATRAYEAPSPVFLLLACNVGLFGLYQIGFYVVLLDRGSVPSLGLMGLAAGANALFNAILVPEFGMVGAALAGCISNVLLASITLRLSRTVLPWRFPWADAMRIGLRAGIMGGILWIASTREDMTRFPNLAAALFLAAAVYFLLDILDKKTSLRSLIRSS